MQWSSCEPMTMNTEVDSKWNVVQQMKDWLNMVDEERGDKRHAVY